MNQNFFKRFLASLTVCAMFSSSLVPGFTSAVQAAPANEWDPLVNWQPGNGQTFDPVEDLLGQVMQGAPTPGTGNVPVAEVADASGTLPQDPVDKATGQLRLAERDFDYPTLGPDLPLTIARTYTGQNTDQLSMFGYGWSIPQERYLQMYNDFNLTDYQAGGGSENYTFIKDKPVEEAFVEEYDG
ncbi:MAG TPA: DUF6531 domain-containing protein, partial [Bacilli bacterium]|nr:DUF6531 domain-containing protein [Bacilli bacterium]